MPLISLLLAQAVALEKSKDRVEIKVDGAVVGTYVFDDPVVRRPYFANLRVPGGPQVTRNHPTKEHDAADHATMHPGIWMSFGDLGGADFWRNKGRVQPAFLRIEGTAIQAGFQYRAGDAVVCQETARITLLSRPDGLLIVLDSAYTSEAPFAFGDQEEMGFGVRLSTALTVKAGGRIVDSEGRENEKGIWGKTPAWADYGSSAAGVLVIPDPANFRPSWFHVRDYGLLVANPFGRKAFTKGEPSRVEIKPGETFRLRYAALLHGGELRPRAAADAVLETLRSLPRP